MPSALVKIRRAARHRVERLARWFGAPVARDADEAAVRVEEAARRDRCASGSTPGDPTCASRTTRARSCPTASAHRALPDGVEPYDVAMQINDRILKAHHEGIVTFDVPHGQRKRARRGDLGRLDLDRAPAVVVLGRRILVKRTFIKGGSSA